MFGLTPNWGQRASHREKRPSHTFWDAKMFVLTNIGAIKWVFVLTHSLRTILFAQIIYYVIRQILWACLWGKTGGLKSTGPLRRSHLFKCSSKTCKDKTSNSWIETAWRHRRLSALHCRNDVWQPCQQEQMYCLFWPMQHTLDMVFNIST